MWFPATSLTALLVVAVPAVLTQTMPPQNKLFGYLPRAGLHSLSMDQLDAALDLMADMLEERSLSGGDGTVVTSRLAAPTLLAEDELCRNHTEIYWDGLANGTFWALQMFDATGKLPDGILVGNVNTLGSYDECLDTRVSLDNNTYPSLPEDGLHFIGRYVAVMAFGAPPAKAAEADDGQLGEIIILPQLLGSTGTVGFCVPSSCSSEDVQAGLQAMLGHNITVIAGPSSTQADTVELTAGDIVVITLMALVAALMVAGTGLDMYHRWYNDQLAKEMEMTSVVDSPNGRLSSMLHIGEAKPARLLQRKPPVLPTSQQALIAFSVYTNTIKLLDTTPGRGTLTCLHGLRFISMTWVVLGHASSFVLYFTQNSIVITDWIKNPLFQAVVNALPSVDTFFLLSGVLLSYMFCGAYEKTKRFNLPLFYLHRYLRLTPALAIMLAINATWFIHVGSGPLWPYNTPSTTACQNYWWRNMLYINNMFDWNDMCVAQSWYLAADMQMFLFSPLVLLPLVWRPLFGAMWLGVVTVAFVVLRIVIYDVKDFDALIFQLRPAADPEETADWQSNYGYPWMRCTVWLTGIGLGYLLHRLRGKQVTMRWWQWLAGWIVAFAVGVSVVYGMAGYQMPWDPMPSKAVNLTYGGLHRFAWGLAVSWVIFACVTGYGGFVNTFLSYPGFIPLSRLTYATYLIHINVIYFVDFSQRAIPYYDVLRYVYHVVAHLIVSLAFAVPLTLAFEAPFMTLEKLLFAPSRPDVQLKTTSVEPEKKQ